MVIFSLWSRFNSRQGSASTKGTLERLNKLGVLYWQHEPGCIFYGFCRTRQEFEHVKRTLSIYAGCKYPIYIDSADGSLTYRKVVHQDGQSIKTQVKVADTILAKIQGRL